jgi:hypothetical protein
MTQNMSEQAQPSEWAKKATASGDEKSIIANATRYLIHSKKYHT